MINNASRGVRSFLLTAISFIFLLALVPGVFAAGANVTLTSATGGSAMTASDTITFTTLSGPTLAESNSPGDIAVGTVVLNAPAGFEFDSSSSVKVQVRWTGGGNGNSGNNINNLANNANITATVSSSQISITITDVTASGAKNSLTWSGIKVRPTSTTPTRGNITKTGTSSYITSSPNYGTLISVTPDSVAPVISVPSTITQEATSASGNVVNYVANATDNLDGNVAVSCSPTSGSTFAITTTQVTCNAYDNAGNNASASFDVVIEDTQLPITTDNAPAGWQNSDVTVTLSPSDSGSGIDYTLYCVDQDNTCTPSTSGTSVVVSTEGTNYVRYASTDNSGNVESVNSATVELDKTNPSISGSIISGDEGDNGWYTSAVTVHFDCSDSLSGLNTCSSDEVLNSEASGQTSSGSASDNAGNTNSFDVTGINIDLADPELNLPSLSAVEATSADGAEVNFAVSGTDSVDASVDVECDYNSGDTFPIGTTEVSCTATDDSGRQVSGSFNVVVQDTTAPSMSLDDIEVFANDSQGATITFDALASDDVDSEVTVECDYNSGDFFNIGTTLVTCTATDDYNNVVQETFNVIVKDSTNPSTTLSVADPKYSADETNFATSDTEFTLDASDNINVSETYYSINGGQAQTYEGSFYLDEEGEYNIEYWSVDLQGNEEEHQSFNVIVDNIASYGTEASISEGSMLNGVHTSDVDVSFNCADEVSGCGTIYYSWNGVDYSQISPDGSVSTSGAEDGEATLYYYSADNLGNTEDGVHTLSLVLDRSAPFAVSGTTHSTISFNNLPDGSFTFNADEISSEDSSVEGFVLGSNYFNFTSNLPNGQFSVTLTFSYNDVDQDGFIDGTNVSETDFAAYYYDENSAQWVAIANPVRDVDANTITVTVDHFTLFSLLYAPVAPSAPAPAPSSSSGGSGGSTGLKFNSTSDSNVQGSTNVPSEANSAEANTNAATNIPITGGVIGSLGSRGSGVLIGFIILVFAGAIYLNLRQARKALKAKKK